MPFKSKAQRRKFAELLVKGKISPETYEEWNRETGSAELPERVRPRRAGAKKSTAKRKTSTAKRKKVTTTRKKSPTKNKRSRKARRR
jgi:hypothetical protein